jgi:hypothetical protein
MGITFQKRQKEMKRQEKQRAKAERRAQKKLANREGVKSPEDDLILEPLDAPLESPQFEEGVG